MQPSDVATLGKLWRTWRASDPTCGLLQLDPRESPSPVAVAELARIARKAQRHAELHVGRISRATITLRAPRDGSAEFFSRKVRRAFGDVVYKRTVIPVMVNGTDGASEILLFDAEVES